MDPNLANPPQANSEDAQCPACGIEQTLDAYMRNREPDMTRAEYAAAAAACGIACALFDALRGQSSRLILRACPRHADIIVNAVCESAVRDGLNPHTLMKVIGITVGRKPPRGRPECGASWPSWDPDCGPR